MGELDSVGDEEGFDGRVNELETAVVVESGSNAETRAFVKGSREWHGSFVVDDHGASHGAQQDGIIVERAMEVFPIENGGGERSLVEKVEGEFRLGEKFVPEVVGEAVIYTSHR